MNTLQTQDEIFYSASSRRDSTFEGIFVAAVKTTGVFCRPTCPARKPKRENVEFFNSTRDALMHGYRPCKICKPMEYKGAPPAWLQPLLDEITSAPTIKIKDDHLRERGLEPSRVRYWFKKHHGMTFQEYQRLLRIGQAFGKIKNGEKVTEAAFQSGYGSLSGFANSFKKTVDFSPSKSQDNHIISTMQILTPLGPMLAGATDKGICLLEFVDRRMLETQIKRLSKRLRSQFVPGSSNLLDELQCQLQEYFSGKRRDFTVPLVMPGTPFQKKVWEKLLAIPYGSIHSYKEQAEIIDAPNAVRAVAKANGDNNIAIVVPCHRVVGSNGELVGYGGGLWRKQFLLKHEKENLK